MPESHQPLPSSKSCLKPSPRVPTTPRHPSTHTRAHAGTHTCSHAPHPRHPAQGSTQHPCDPSFHLPAPHPRAHCLASPGVSSGFFQPHSSWIKLLISPRTAAVEPPPQQADCSLPRLRLHTPGVAFAPLSPKPHIRLISQCRLDLPNVSGIQPLLSIFTATPQVQPFSPVL